MTKEELNYIKDAFSLIIEDIAGNPDWPEAARAVASDLGTLERKLEEKVASIPSNLDEAAIQAAQIDMCDRQIMEDSNEHRMLYSRIFRRGFKSGAEWMAGQGQTFEAHVDNGCAIASGVKLPFVLWDTYEDGDVLKVQIRKK